MQLISYDEKQHKLASMTDKVGISFRGEMAKGIFANLDKIDAFEIIADAYFPASKREWKALRTLTREKPVIFHGVGMGLASTSPVREDYLANFARLLDFVGAEVWTEHLAFVRASGIEIGHLAMPPPTEASRDGTIRNIERAKRVLGGRKCDLENIATIFRPPGNTMPEARWVTEVLTDSDSGLLLDLHNLYANARNFGPEPAAYLDAFPLERVSSIHISGGKWIAEPAVHGDPAKLRLLDNHMVDAPDEVFALLETVASRVAGPLTVIWERDGRFPEDFAEVEAQLGRARKALATGRARQAETPATPRPEATP